MGREIMEGRTQMRFQLDVVYPQEYKHGFNKVFRILYPAKSGTSEGDKMKKTIAIVLWLLLLIICCGTFRDFERRAEIPEVASVCDYKVGIIYRAQFRTDTDFYDSVTAQVEWFLKHDHEVLKVNYEWNYDMTHNLILRFAVISYRPKGGKDEEK